MMLPDIMQHPIPARRRGGLRLAALALCSALFLSSCAGTDGTDSEENGTDGENASELAMMVPDSIRDKGHLNVAMASYPTAVIDPPDGGDPEGWEPETAEALGDLLDLEFRIDLIPFDGIVPGMTSNRYDLAMGAYGVRPERREAFTFVTEYRSTQGFLSRQDSDITIVDQLDLCGKNVAVQQGSTQYEAMEENKEACDDAGEATIELTPFPGIEPAVLAVKSGRVELSAGEIVTLEIASEEAGDELKVDPVEGDWSNEHLTGIMIAEMPDEEELADAIAAAMNELIDNGTYLEIHEKWLADDGAIEESEVLPRLG